MTEALRQPGVVAATNPTVQQSAAASQHGHTSSAAELIARGATPVGNANPTQPEGRSHAVGGVNNRGGAPGHGGAMIRSVVVPKGKGKMEKRWRRKGAALGFAGLVRRRGKGDQCEEQVVSM